MNSSRFICIAAVCALFFHTGCTSSSFSGASGRYESTHQIQQAAKAQDSHYKKFAKLNENEIITQIYRVTGTSKLHVHAVASSNDEMENLMNNVIDNIDGIVKYNCNIIISRIKDIKGLRL